MTCKSSKILLSAVSFFSPSIRWLYDASKKVFRNKCSFFFRRTAPSKGVFEKSEVVNAPLCSLPFFLIKKCSVCLFFFRTSFCFFPVYAFMLFADAASEK